MGQGWAWGFLRKVTGVHAVSSVTCWSRLPRVSSPDWSEPCGASGGRTRPSVALLSLSPVLLELVLKFPSGPLALLPRSPAIHLSLSGLCPRLTQDQPCSPALPAGPGQTLPTHYRKLHFRDLEFVLLRPVPSSDLLFLLFFSSLFT